MRATRSRGWTSCRPSRFDRHAAGNAARNDEGGLNLGILWIILIVILILALLGFFTRGRW